MSDPEAMTMAERMSALDRQLTILQRWCFAFGLVVGVVLTLLLVLAGVAVADPAVAPVATVPAPALPSVASIEAGFERRGHPGFRIAPCQTGPSFNPDRCPIDRYRGDFTPAEISALLARVFPEDPVRWQRRTFCESGFNRFAVGRLRERGLLQVHPVHARPGGLVEQTGFSWDDMFEVGPNLAVAHAIYAEQGSAAWAGSASCTRRAS